MLRTAPGTVLTEGLRKQWLLAIMLIDVRISYISTVLYQFTEYVNVTFETHLSRKASLGGRWREVMWGSLKPRMKTNRGLERLRACPSSYHLQVTEPVCLCSIVASSLSSLYWPEVGFLNVR